MGRRCAVDRPFPNRTALLYCILYWQTSQRDGPRKGTTEREGGRGREREREREREMKINDDFNDKP